MATENQSTVKYGLWTGVLSIARCTDDEDTAIVDTRSEHAEYDLDTCKRKAASFDGPRRCIMLANDASDSGFANACDGCPARQDHLPIVPGYPDFRPPNEPDAVTQARGRRHTEGRRYGSPHHWHEHHRAQGTPVSVHAGTRQARGVRQGAC